MTSAAPTIRTTGRPQTVDPTTGVALGLSWLLAAAATAASVATLTVPDLLSGTPVMNGSAMGTALVVLVIAVPSSRSRPGAPAQDRSGPSSWRPASRRTCSTTP